MRLSTSVFVFLLSISTLASADLKIKTRTTVMGHSTESTVYIKGSRERTEMSFGGHGGAVSIMQCDQKRMVTVMGDRCTVISMGGESSCPAMPDMRAMGRNGGMGEGEPTPVAKGGVVTISRTATDTGERQEMFGYKARHIRSSMMMESTPDACNQSHMKMEIDGWYADLADFSCGDEGYRAMACGGGSGKRGCTDRIVVKNSGGAALGYPLKQTMTMTSAQGTFTTTTEVDRADEHYAGRSPVRHAARLQSDGYVRHGCRRDGASAKRWIDCSRAHPSGFRVRLQHRRPRVLRLKLPACCALASCQSKIPLVSRCLPTACNSIS